MAFVTDLILELVRLLLIAAVAFGGILLGKRFRDRSDAKKAAAENEEQ